MHVHTGHKNYSVNGLFACIIIYVCDTLTSLIQKRMAETGMNQLDLALRLGISQPLISKIIIGKPEKHRPEGRKIPLSSVDQWADALRLDGAERTRFIDLVYESHAPEYIRKKLRRLEEIQASMRAQLAELSEKLDEIERSGQIAQPGLTQPDE